MKFFCVSFLIAAAVLASEDDHASGESCACASIEKDFFIDCTKSEVMTDALATLIAENCSTDCSSETCHKNFLIVQSHHDFCLHEEVPAPLEDSFHDYEGVCEECSIMRKRDPALNDCRTAVCDDRGDESFQKLLTSGCLNNCNTTTCAQNYQILRTEHDNCEHDILSEAAEKGIHDYEEICEVNNCNSLLSEKEVAAQLICIPHGQETTVNVEKSSADGVARQVSGFFVALSGFVFLANH